MFLTDSYKLSHWTQYPPGMTWAQSYLESRGGVYDEVVFFGLQYYLYLYLEHGAPSSAEVEYAAQLASLHGLPFNRAGWDYIAELGYLPLKIYAVPEGSVHKPGKVLMTVESTDPACAWLVSWVETLLLKVWYPCTVASKSLHVRRIMEQYYPGESWRYAYHNFGDRGSSSVETAAIGGAAHLTQFLGTDNFGALTLVHGHYDMECAGYSIPATEHSTVTSWGRFREFEMYESYLESCKGRSMAACVLDSYNLYDAVRWVCTYLKERVESPEYPTFVLRPDSGNPIEVLPKMIKIMEECGVAGAQAPDGYLFEKFRIIWGDGITPEIIDIILEHMREGGYSARNFAFGSGGDLMQNVTRDTCKFAFKMCAAVVNGQEIEVYKAPSLDLGKMSKRGRQTLPEEYLRFYNGAMRNVTTFADVRKASA